MDKKHEELVEAVLAYIEIMLLYRDSVKLTPLANAALIPAVHRLNAALIEIDYDRLKALFNKYGLDI